MKIAGIYARVSSDKQKNESTIDSQIKELIDFAQSKDMRVPPDLHFIDDGFSGSDFRRPSLERLRDFIRTGQIETVFVYAPDRLARNYVHQELLREEFRKAGVELLFIKSPPANTPEERLLVQFQGMIAEYERELIKERTRRGRKHRAQAGCVSVLSSAPLGYRYVRKTLEADAYYEILQDEAMVVKEIFRLYTEEGLSLSGVVKQLKEKKLTKRKGSFNWSRSVIRAILKNPAYVGEACYGKTTKKDRPCTPVTRRKKIPTTSRENYRQPNERESWIPIAVPAIVDKYTFELAQEMLEKNKRFSPRNTKQPSLLQGLLVCEACGRSYYKRSYKNGDKTSTYYCCIGVGRSSTEGMKACKNGLIRQDQLDISVWEHVLQLLRDPSVVQNEIERRIQVVKCDIISKQEEEKLGKEKKRLEMSADALLDAYQEELLDLEGLKERMRKIKYRKNAIDKQLESLKRKEANLEVLAKISLNVETFLAQLTQSEKNLSFHEKQKIIRLVVKQITIGVKRNKERDIVITHCIPTKEKCDGLTEENLQLCTYRSSQ